MHLWTAAPIAHAILDAWSSDELGQHEMEGAVPPARRARTGRNYTERQGGLNQMCPRMRQLEASLT